MTVKEMRNVAKELGIKGYTKMNKEQLTDALEYEKFKQDVKENILSYLPEKYVNCNVQISTIAKNNEVLDALTIASPTSNMVPTIYLNSIYEQYKSGTDMETILRKIASIRTEHEVTDDFDVNDITDFAKVKGKIQARLFGVNGNAMLKDRPHILFADDLAITFCIMLGENAEGTMSVPITNQLMETWGVNKEELYELAKENLETPTFKSMNEVMTEMMLPGMINDFGSEEEAREMLSQMMPDDGKMFVLSNYEKLNGAVSIIDTEFLMEIKDMVGDFYILPSSIHECLIVPKNVGIAVSELKTMVKDVNDTQVAPQDLLSYSVYEFVDGKVKVA